MERSFEVPRINRILKTANLGLQDETVVQYWSENKKFFVYGQGARYHLQYPLDTYDSYKDKLQCLVQNFGPHGPMYPMVGICCMGELENDRVARLTSKHKPFWLTNKITGPDHAVLIKGIHVIKADPLTLSVHLQNSWGASWGKGGFAWVNVSFFNTIICFNENEQGVVIEP